MLVDVERFWRDGYVIVKRVFTPPQIEGFRSSAYAALAADRAAGRVLTNGNVSYPYGDLLSKDGLRQIVLDDGIREIAAKLLGAEPIYFGYSSFQLGGEPRPRLSWHKDNRLGDRDNPRGLDWKADRYPLIRFGVYFQDHAQHSGGLAVRAGSHRTTRLWWGKPTLVSTEPGDVVVWSMTATHSGQATRLRIPGNLALGGHWMRLLPERFRAPEEKERIAAFLTFARESDDLERYITHLKTERAHDELEWFRHSRFGDEVWDLVKQSGLEVRRIIPEYGTPRA